MNEFVSISELKQRRKYKINSKNIAERFLFRLFDSSVMLQIAERVCTLRSVVDRGCEIVSWRRLEKLSKLIVRGVGIVGRVGKKLKF